jgi:hypothetical protein
MQSKHKRNKIEEEIIPFPSLKNNFPNLFHLTKVCPTFFLRNTKNTGNNKKKLIEKNF